LNPEYLFSELEPSFIEERHRVIPSSTSSRYEGKIVVLINEETISHGEHSCLYLKASSPNCVFIGSPTSGANGNVTNCHLPGGIVVGFTGFGAFQSDRSQFQRKGITPDILVKPTVYGIRNGEDEVFNKAIEYLSSSFSKK